ncbi:DsbA family protein [bacterium]|nr:DsbA family protein [bacterium]
MEKIKSKKKKWFLKWWGILLILLGIIVIIFSVYFVDRVFYYRRLLKSGSIISTSILGQYSNYSGSSELENIQINRNELEAQDEPQKGAKNPIMTIVEFADFDCPYCVVFHEDLKYFVAENKEQVKLIFRDFPLKNDDLAMFANCAFEQDKFWEMHDHIFENFENFNENLAYAYIRDLDLDLDKFKDCYQNRKYEIEIKDDLRIGLNSGVQGTPTIFINGERFVGVMNQNILRQILAVLENTD